MITLATLSVRQLVDQVLRLLRLSTPFNSVNPDYIEQTLFCLNQSLAAINATAVETPYLVTKTLTITSDKSIYLIGDGVEADLVTSYFTFVEFCTYLFDEMRLPIKIVPDAQWLSTIHPIPSNNQGPPSYCRTYLYQSALGVMYTAIDLFNLPDQDYTLEIRGKQKISQVVYNDTITYLPDFFAEYLILETVRRVYPYYARADIWSDLQQRWQEIRDSIQSASKVDLSVNPDCGMLWNSWPNYPMNIKTTS